MNIYITDNQKKYGDDFKQEFLKDAENICVAIKSNNKITDLFEKFFDNSYVNVTFASKAKIREINFENRKIDRATDVLSFPMLDLIGGKSDSSIGPEYFEYDDESNQVLCLGDVVICLEVCADNALKYGHSLRREAAFLFAHSMLHLLGYDHIKPEDEKKMIPLQKKLMVDIGLGFEDEEEFVSGLSDIDSSDEEVVYEAGTVCKHVGYCALLGRPNVGKSTLMNYIMGMKLAIVSHKPQTTRTNIRSIYNSDDTQIIFVDTPGVHNPHSELSRIMVENSFNSAKNADVVLMIADGRFEKPASVEKKLMELCKANGKKVILAVNKSDDVSKESILPIIKNYSELFDFDEIIPISARTGDNIDILISKISERLPEGPRLFDTFTMTDQTEREISAELIREQILHYTNQEIPHGTAVVIDEFKEKLKDNAVDEYDREMVVIHASIICERDSHKGIILGKDGQMIKRIGSKARISIERLCGCKVYLDLYVKVRTDWKNDSSFLKSFGYEVEEDK